MQPVWARAPAWRCALRMFNADEQTLRPPWVQDVLRVQGIANQRLKIPEKRCPARIHQNRLLDTGTASCCHMSAISTVVRSSPIQK